MDLALAFGLPLGELRGRMTEREFGLWGRYASERGLPWRRVELMLAQICMYLDLARKPQGASARIADYLIGEKPREKSASERSRIAREMASFGAGGIVIRRSAAHG